MSYNKNKKTYNYNNKEMVKQQSRKSDINKPYTSQVFQEGKTISVNVEDDDEELVYYMEFKGEKYAINAGYITLLEIMKIQKDMEDKKRKAKMQQMNGTQNNKNIRQQEEDGFYSFNKVLEIAFEDGEYKRFFKNNKNISLATMSKVAYGIVQLLSTQDPMKVNKDIEEVGDSQDNFR